MARGISLLLLLMFAAPGRLLRAPLAVSFWYWHTPFQLSSSEVRQLKEIGVKRLFVRAGTFSHDYKLTVPQQWACSGAPFSVSLVYNFDSGLLRHFEDLDIGEASREMAKAINASGGRAKKAGAQIEGVQLDIDCPTRLLPKYAELLGAIRPKIDLKKPWNLSVTGLSSWLGTRGFKEVADKVDFLAPQFYESDIAFEENQVRTIGDIGAIERGLPKAASLNKPIYAGLATYGRALLYDPQGHLAGIYRSLSPEDAVRDPYLKYLSLEPLGPGGFATSEKDYAGEDQLTLVALGPDQEARGYRLVYDLPTPQLLAREIEAVQKSAPENCQGIILYRMPQDEDGMALLVPSVKSVLQGKTPKSNIALKVSSSPNPWRLVDSQSKQISSDIKVEATNLGDGPTGIGPHAVQILVRWPGKGLINAQAGDFDSIYPGECDPKSGDFQPCPPGEANAALLFRSRILPGQHCESGFIEVEGPAKAEGVLSALTPGDFGNQTSHATSIEHQP